MPFMPSILHWIVKHGILDVIDGGSKLVTSDGEDQVICSPCLASGSNGGQ